MSIEENKNIQQRVFEALNRRDANGAGELSTPECKFYGFATQTLDLEGYLEFTKWSFTVFPDLHFMIEDMLAEGDKVTTRFTEYGSQQGELMGAPASGKPFTLAGITISRFENGKIVEVWGVFDRLAMLQQLGLMP
jgi:steroid delta-isomerase-like uncharacterized protein